MGTNLSSTIGIWNTISSMSNTWIGLAAASLQVIPCILIGFWEDRELIARNGFEHKEYIKQTALLFPIRKLLGFLKLLLFWK